MAGEARIGIIAGGGPLPVALAEHLNNLGRPAFVVRLAGFADPSLEAFEGGGFNIGEIGAQFAALKAAGCGAVVFAGLVHRVDLGTLTLDAAGAALIPRVLAAMQLGDDALLRVFVDAAEEAGFAVLGAEAACPELIAQAGPLGAFAPDDRARRDMLKAARVAAALGALDVGQGCVVADGLVLAVEAQEGTDAMLARVAGLPAAIRGAGGERRGVLLKRPKPIQERRIDLPTIGVRTVEGAIAAGLAGIAVEAGAALVMQRGLAIAQANAAGLFVFGYEPHELEGA